MQPAVPNWRAAYVRRVIAGDVFCGLVAAAVGLLVNFGVESPEHVHNAALGVAFVLPVLWPLVMLLAGSYEHRFLWTGAEEFVRVFWASIILLAGTATISWAFKLDVARGFVVVTLPLVTVLTLLLRYGHRRVWRRRRAEGGVPVSVLIVGHADGVLALHRQIERVSYRGYRILGCCVPGEGDRAALADGPIPVLGDLGEVAGIVRACGIDAVAALPSQDLDGDHLRRLGWDLEDTPADLLLVPSLAEVAGARLRVRPAFGLPALQVERLDLTGHRGLLKSVLDRTAAAILLVLLSWAFVLLCLSIRCTTSGPVFFRHERIGRNGQPFHMYKFRSMYQGADRQFDALLERSDGNAVQFKMRRDPRVTPIGRFLRRFSIDELPQLFNVLGGSMSLVGPRPHVQREVDQYDRDMRCRLLVKPGITGLWQVSGRSDLSWEDSVRTDVRYVQNWSIALDLMILSKTVRAVLRGSGAY